MQTQNALNAAGIGWLGFELNVLPTFEVLNDCSSAVAGGPSSTRPLPAALGRAGFTNDPAHGPGPSQAFIENNCDSLSEEDVATILDDAYVPRNYFRNPTLLTWFNETDAWWFDNVRANADRLSSPYKRALALALGMSVGDYVFSFNLDTRDLRQPLSLSNVFRRLWHTALPPVNNLRRNTSSNRSAKAFVAEMQDTDVMFLRLRGRPARRQPQRTRDYLEKNGSAGKGFGANCS